MLSGGGDPMPADNGDAEGAGAPQGLSWSYEMDFGALIAAITGAGPPGADAPSAGPPDRRRLRPALLPPRMMPFPRVLAWLVTRRVSLPARRRRRPRRRPS